MPRVCASNSDPIDFCRKCMPSKKSAEKLYGVGEYGPDGRGNCFEYNAEHPDYEGEGYTCEFCEKDLTDRDN